VGGRPPAGAVPRAGGRSAAVPHDTSLDASSTAAALDVELPGVTEMLHRMCEELTPA
jgi:hypothetical protein